MRRIGVHVSIAGGIHLAPERAHALGCTCMQIFGKSPRMWDAKPITPDEAAAFREARFRFDIAPVFVHAPYLLNIASPDDALRSKSVRALRDEMLRAGAIGAEYVVLHPGSCHDGEGRARASLSIKEALSGLKTYCGLLIENTSGKRGDIATAPAELGEIMDRAGGLVAGVCIDSAHAHAAGYDMRADGSQRLASELERYVGHGLVKLIHLNDSRSAMGSGTDRHADIGMGTIGSGGLRAMLSVSGFSGVPVVLETPKESDEDDLRNLAAARALF